MEFDKVLWIKLVDLKEGIYNGKKFKIAEDVTEEPDTFNAGKKKYVMHMVEAMSTQKYNANLNNASIYNLMKVYGKETVNWIDKIVTVELQIVKGKEAIVFKPSG